MAAWVGAPRDLVLLVATGALAGGMLLVAARQAYQSRPEHPTTQCIERWDEQSEWLPHVDCTMPIRASRRNK